MQFALEFDDVYDAVLQAAQAADARLEIVRMDEIRSAGYITDDMLREIEGASLCIVDATGLSSNVMFECGYATALHKPMIVLYQVVGELPFDIRDIRAIRYDRSALASTLRRPLQAALKATLVRYIDPA
jgi:nucleoside 2-deoxyribosyltransferase